jgi:hypothetical protein
MTLRAAVIHRSPVYSPAGHRENDAAILEAVAAHLAARGLAIVRGDERDVERGEIPRADLYLNMCQGPRASRRLYAIDGGAVIVNRPESVLGCHRRRLVRRLAASGVAFPATTLVATRSRAPVRGFEGDPRVWVKRGDVHAERLDDVVAVDPADLPRALAAFAARGIRVAAVQRHVSGPVIKFYGVAGGRFFRWYDAAAGPRGSRPDADEHALRRLAFTAAAALGLEVFGGDLVLPSPGAPVLVDLNDWPSFAPFRDDAARAIAEYIEERIDPGGASGAA